MDKMAHMKADMVERLLNSPKGTVTIPSNIAALVMVEVSNLGADAYEKFEVLRTKPETYEHADNAQAMLNQYQRAVELTVANIALTKAVGEDVSDLQDILKHLGKFNT
jgi:hypothetical protein